MNKIILSFIFILCCNELFAQNKTINIPKYLNGNTIYLHAYIQNLASHLELELISKSNDSINLRIWLSNQVIDIWSIKNNIFEGTLINYIETAKKTSFITRNNKLIFSKVKLDTFTSHIIFNLFQSIDNIPSKENIKNWKGGKDGETYIFEKSDKFNYSFKNYWSPCCQDSLLFDAKKIEQLIKDILSISVLAIQGKKFYNNLPKGLYKEAQGFRLLIKKKTTSKTLKKLNYSIKKYRQLE
ncbi:MAG: hypothetical protein ACEQSR_09370 [Candidatus Methylacidiphilales bacterium]